MVSEKRAAANRANAGKSTGPKSGAGRAKAAKNALAHGLCAARPVLPGEAADEWDRHRTGVVITLAPVSALEEGLAERVAACLWRLRRVVAAETAAAAAGLEEASESDPPVPDDRLSPAGRDARRLAKLEAELAETRGMVADWADTAALHAALPDLPDDAPVEAGAVEGLLSDVTGALPGSKDEYFDFEDQEFLADLGVPEPYRPRPYEWHGWTAGGVRAAVAAAAAEFGAVPDELLAQARADRAEGQRESDARAARLAAEARAIRGRTAARARRAVLRSLLPDSATLEKFARYEAHLSRQMLQALHTLERLQAARAGKDVPPPAAADLTVDAG